MCGICGKISFRGSDVIDEASIRRMCNALIHRGPDDEGIYLGSSKPQDSRCSVGLGHRRLSIIDLSKAGHQPMANEDKTIWIVLNGEIYNFYELRVDLEKKGHNFKSNTDTETVIHLYEEYGNNCVDFLRGMFAFAIWDERKKRLLLARDRVGKKPLLYAKVNDVFCFASEFSALLESGYIKKEINYDAIHYYLTFGYIPAPLTIYDNVFKLPPAHRLILESKNITLEQYWELDYSKKICISEQDAAEEIIRLLKESVKIRLYSDVPLGAFLSGGIDSSTIVALMSQLSKKKVKTFSIGFEEQNYNELRYAKAIADRFNTEHNEFIVQPKALEILPLLVERYGEPYADSSCIPSYYVARQTKQFVTVALNGDGGDELFGGYERYQAMLIAERLPSITKKILGVIVTALPDSVNRKNQLGRIKRFLNGSNLPRGQRYLRWVGIFNESLKQKMYSEYFSGLISQAGPLGFIEEYLNKSNTKFSLDSLLYTDTMTYLPNDLLVKVDITSMANSLEARSPFLDHKLMEFAARLPVEYKMKKFIKKYILKKAVKNLILQENIHRKKMGFGIPISEWFRKDLKEFLCDTLFSKPSLGRGYFKPQAVKDMVKMHIEKQRDYAFQLWALLMLELWHRRFID